LSMAASCLGGGADQHKKRFTFKKARLISFTVFFLIANAAHFAAALPFFVGFEKREVSRRNKKKRDTPTCV